MSTDFNVSDTTKSEQRHWHTRLALKHSLSSVLKLFIVSQNHNYISVDLIAKKEENLIIGKSYRYVCVLGNSEGCL